MEPAANLVFFFPFILNTNKNNLLRNKYDIKLLFELFAKSNRRTRVLFVKFYNSPQNIEYSGLLVPRHMVWYVFFCLVLVFGFFPFHPKCEEGIPMGQSSSADYFWVHRNDSFNSII